MHILYSLFSAQSLSNGVVDLGIFFASVSFIFLAWQIGPFHFLLLKIKIWRNFTNCGTGTGILDFDTGIICRFFSGKKIPKTFFLTKYLKTSLASVGNKSIQIRNTGEKNWHVLLQQNKKLQLNFCKMIGLETYPHKQMVQNRQGMFH